MRLLVQKFCIFRHWQSRRHWRRQPLSAQSWCKVCKVSFCACGCYTATAATCTVFYKDPKMQRNTWTNTVQALFHRRPLWLCRSYAKQEVQASDIQLQAARFGCPPFFCAFPLLFFGFLVSLLLTGLRMPTMSVDFPPASDSATSAASKRQPRCAGALSFEKPRGSTCPVTS